MPRVIMTFETLHKVLSAEKALRADTAALFKCRPTPTPPGLSDSICGMSIELLEHERTAEVLAFLKDAGTPPAGIHTLV
jgi:hypothetical protein